MKQLFAVIVCVLPLSLSANDWGLNRGILVGLEQYARALHEVDAAALFAADQMYKSGSGWRAHDLDSISDYANELARETRRDVMRELYEPGFRSYRQAQNAWERLGHERASLSRAYRNLHHGSTRELDNAFAKLQVLEPEIEAEFEDVRPGPIGPGPGPIGPGPGPIGPGPIGPGPGGFKLSANCNCKFGGNFLRKESHVECTFVNGPTPRRGAQVEYFINFSNPQSGQAAQSTGVIAHGSDKFSTSNDKKNVGRYANFSVQLKYRGQAVEVSNGQCDGNPF